MHQDHIKALDGLRGVAALIVVFSHLSLTSWGRPPLLGGLLGNGAGQIGVMIFFVLSGFLMGYLYLPRPAAAEAILGFWQRRIARVVPLALLVLVYSLGMKELFPNDWRMWAYDLNGEEIIDFFSLQYYGVILWTIAVEIQFYLLFPLLWLAMRAFGSVGCLLPIALIVLDRSAAFGLPALTGWRVLGILGHFFLGGLAVAALRVHAWRLPDWLWNAAFVGSVGATIMLYPAVANMLFGSYDGLTLGQIAGSLWSNIAYLVVPVMLVASCTKASYAQFLGHSVGRWLGDISYSVYLLHIPVLWYWNRFTDLGETPWLFVVVGLTTVFLVSSAVYYGFERPMRRAITGIRLPRRQHAAPAE